MNFDRDAVRN